MANDPNHLIVTQPSFFTALPETLSAMSRHLGLPSPGPGVADQVRAHLDPSLNHHRSTDSPDPGATPLAALASLVWNDGDVDVDRIPPMSPPSSRRAGSVASATSTSWPRAVRRSWRSPRRSVSAIVFGMHSSRPACDVGSAAARRWAEAKVPW